MPRMPVICVEKCNGCGLCVDVCRCNAFVLVGNVITITESDDCGWCMLCELVCPTGAILCPFDIIIEES